MTRPTGWWWVRHAPLLGFEGRLAGRLDVDCDTSDEASFQALAAMLPSDAMAVVSPLKRTRQTLAAIAAAGARLRDPLVEPDFVEQSFGCWEGLSWAEMHTNDPAAYAAFWRNPTRNTPPRGESFEAQMRRVANAVERLTTAFAGSDIVSISHGGSIRAAVALTLGLTPDAAMAIAVDNLSVTRLSQVHDHPLSSGRAAWMVQAVNAPCRWIAGRHVEVPGHPRVAS